MCNFDNSILIKLIYYRNRQERNNKKNMELFNLKKEYYYLLYGAASRGRELLKNMKVAGYNVVAFLDIRADILKSVDNVVVVHPDIYKCNELENTVVIISNSNPFDHLAIADNLYNLGYEKIVYSLFPGMYGISHEIDVLKQTYDDIFHGKINENSLFCKYLPQWSEAFFEDGAYIQDVDEHIVAYIPVDLCYKASKEYFYELFGNYVMENSPDICERFSQPMYMSSCEQNNLFKAFLGNVRDKSKAVERFVELWKNNLCIYYETFPRTLEGQEAMLTNRYNAFLGMLRAFRQSGMDFFIRHPIEVYWDEKGYFVSMDGGHRISFLLAMGLRFVPARIRKCDYEKWLNREKLTNCITYARENRIPIANEPILHPHFYFFPNYQDIGGITRLQMIEEVLVYNHINIKGKKVLDVGARYCYYSQTFTRLGAEVTAVEKDPVKFLFGNLLNELLFCTSIQSFCCGVEELDASNRFFLTIMLRVFCSYLNTPLGVKILQNIDGVTEDFLIWESGDHPEEEIRFIVENSSFKTYFPISKTFCVGKLQELGIFCREHVSIDLPEW